MSGLQRRIDLQRIEFEEFILYRKPRPKVKTAIRHSLKPPPGTWGFLERMFQTLFDRVTGEPVWPIVEKPVPRSDVPGERTSPTQPFPTKPAPFDRQGVTENDLIDFTPEIKAEALRIASQTRSSLHASDRRGRRR